MSIVGESWVTRHRITVDEYYRMAEVGLFAPDARVELIEGEIIDMAPIGSRHAGIVNKLNKLLVQAVGERAVVAVQSPIRLSTRSEPQPDVALLKPRPDFYVRGHPVPADVLLVIEVSDATLRYDRTVKVPLYARHGIAEVWIADLENGLLHLFRSPAGATYAEVSTIERPAVVQLPVAPQVAVDLSGLFA
jgi:Uma2 family endonuclease